MFVLLESFSDSMGGWRVRDVLGQSILDLSDGLVEDLLTWRHLEGIISREEARRKKKEDSDGRSIDS
jgi:hypothetical protein